MFGKIFGGKKNEQATEQVVIADIIPPIPAIDEEQMHREELANRIQALDDEERRIVIDNLPIELCFERIQREFGEYRALVDSIIDVVRRNQSEKDL